MALTRQELHIEPITGDAAELVVLHADAFGFIVLNRDRTKRDLTSDTLTVNAKGGDASAMTFTFTADALQTTTGKGKCTLTCPAAQNTLARIGTVLIDLLINDRVRGRLKITLATTGAE